MQQKIGIVIPCYNEAGRFDVSAIKKVLEEKSSYLTLLFVDDGSIDDTGTVLEDFCRNYNKEEAHCIALKENMGKAEAVRYGMNYLMQTGTYDLIGYWDADLATPFKALDDFVPIMEQRLDLLSVIGSRVKLCGRNVIRNPIRHYLGRIFVTFLNMMLSLSLYDTQCGAKLFRKDALEGNIDREFSSRWLFDVELLLRIQFKMGADICSWLYEYPLEEWTDIEGSKVTWKSFISALFDMLGIYVRFKLKKL
ncbi:glycosyltransferase [Thermodesulfobacteriota bacterium]